MSTQIDANTAHHINVVKQVIPEEFEDTLTLSGPHLKVYMWETDKIVSIPSFWSGKG